MKKYLLLIVLSFIVSFTYAQLVNNDNTAQKKQRDLDWFNCSFEQDSVYGAEVNRAYEFLKGKKVKKRPTRTYRDSRRDSRWLLRSARHTTCGVCHASQRSWATPPRLPITHGSDATTARYSTARRLSSIPKTRMATS